MCLRNETGPEQVVNKTGTSKVGYTERGWSL